MYPLIKIKPLLNKSLYSFTKQEAKEYFEWFLAIKDHRLQILENNVKRLFPQWQLDYTKDSFCKLYEWFIQQVAYRPITENEKEEIITQISTTPLLVDIVAIPALSFTDETVSICFDMGIYFGESLIFNVPSVNWMQRLGSTKYIDYAEPLIADKKCKLDINPRRLVENLAQRILDNNMIEITLAELFNKWMLMFSHT